MLLAEGLSMVRPGGLGVSSVAVTLVRGKAFVYVKSVRAVRDWTMNKVWECDEHHDARLAQAARYSM